MNNLFFWIKQYAKVVSASRLINAFKLESSYFLSRILRRNIHWGMPLSISIEPTTSCNLKCPECPSGLKKFSRPIGNISQETIEEILMQFGKYLIYISFYFQGEPLIHPYFSKYVKMLKDKNIIVGTSTNAHFLTKEKSVELIESGLDRLIISLDGTDSETYLKYRKGGDFDLVIENIRSFMKIRMQHKSNSLFVELQFIVFKHNEHQINAIKKLGKELGVDKVSVKTAQLYEFEEGNELMPGQVKYSRYQEYENGKYRIKSSLPNHCHRSWTANVITWDGGVVPCCFDKDAEYRFGNINNKNYKEIISNKEYKSFLNQILKDRSKIDICRNCTEGL
jgi:radical SAM protein with 4Fe4S-binding SPASM domain